MEFLSFRQTEDIAFVTLENPSEFNTLPLKLLQELDKMLNRRGEGRSNWRVGEGILCGA